MSEPADWVKAYARQATADFRTWEFCNQHEAVVPLCHRLLFLQMACEKICKAHLIHAQKVPPADVQTSHGFISGPLLTVIEAQLRRLKKDTRGMEWTLKRVKHWAERIELLNPAVNRGGREPGNCEYPWEDHQGKLHSPLDHAFSGLNFREEAAGRVFLILLGEAIEYYAKQ